MNIAIVSTFPPKKCGIAAYTSRLVDFLLKIKGARAFVVSEGGKDFASENLRVIDGYSRNKEFDRAIEESLNRVKNIDVVHFQHAPDLFPDNQAFINLLKNLAEKRLPLFVTLHTVYSDGKNRAFYKKILKYSSLIVHNEICKTNIDAENPNIYVVPHGTIQKTVPYDKSSARNELGLKESDFVFCFLGFIHIQKNLATAVVAFKNALKENKNLKMVCAGEPSGGKWYNRLYLSLCRLLAGSKNVLWDINFIEEKQFDKYLTACDMILLPYWQKYASASGVLHAAIGMQKPFICSDSPKFDEIKRELQNERVFLPPFSLSKWKSSMLLFANSPNLLNNLKGGMKKLADSTAWDSVAQRHIDCYKRGLK